MEKLKAIDGETLMDKILPPVKFVIDMLLPTGLCILAGTLSLVSRGLLLM